jgi:hypothetical protein
MYEGDVKQSRSGRSTVVFISHDSRDENTARAFSRLILTASDGRIRAFTSTNASFDGGIPYGHDWYATVMRELRNASIFVALLTANSRERPWVLFEAGVAHGLGKPIIGLNLGLPQKALLDSPFHHFQGASFGREDLVGLVSQLVAGHEIGQADEISDLVSRFLDEHESKVREYRALDVQSRQWGRGRTLHYVSQLEPASDFFNRFYGALSAFLSGISDLDMQYHATTHDSCHEVAHLLGTIPRGDAILVNPKGWESRTRSVENLLVALEANSDRYVVFVDREPPRPLLDTPNTSYIGINNRRVGVLAGYAMTKSINRFEKRAYAVFQGPGGNNRAEWCKKTIEVIDPVATIDVVEVQDLPGNDTRDRVMLQRNRLYQRHPEHAVAIFAGNDETARAVCHDILLSRLKDFTVVGCDATREMREWVDNWPHVASATVFNEMHIDETMHEIVTAMSKQIRYVIDPRLYPASLQDLAMSDTQVAALWQEARWQK